METSSPTDVEMVNLAELDPAERKRIQEDKAKANSFVKVLKDPKSFAKSADDERDCFDIYTQTEEYLESMLKTLASTEKHALSRFEEDNRPVKRYKSSEPEEPAPVDPKWGCTEKVEDDGKEDNSAEIVALAQETVLFTETARLIMAKARELALRREQRTRAREGEQ